MFVLYSHAAYGQFASRAKRFSCVDFYWKSFAHLFRKVSSHQQQKLGGQSNLILSALSGHLNTKDRKRSQESTRTACLRLFFCLCARRTLRSQRFRTLNLAWMARQIFEFFIFFVCKLFVTWDEGEKKYLKNEPTMPKTSGEQQKRAMGMSTSKLWKCNYE